MEVTLLSISLGIAIIAFIVNYLRLNAKIDSLETEEKRASERRFYLDRECEKLRELILKRDEEKINLELRILNLTRENKMAKDSIRISVDADKMNEVVSKTKQQIAELITVELFSGKQHETKSM